MYAYDAQGRNKQIDSEIYGILGVTPKAGAVSDEEILDRCILPMINEASRCLEEKVVTSAQDVDLGMIMGTGFPPFRGGLLRYADSIGAKLVVEKLEKYSQRFGARFEPAPALRGARARWQNLLLIRMAGRSGTFGLVLGRLGWGFAISNRKRIRSS